MAITKITTPELFNLQSNNTEGTQLPVMTTTQRNAMTGMSNGELIFNSTTDSVEYYDLGATAWYKIDYATGAFIANFLVVAGGGAGGRTGGGGGAGGYRTSFGTGNINGGNTAVETPLSLSPSVNYNIAIGTGGSPTTTVNGVAGSGTPSFIAASISIESTGGGGAANYAVANGVTGGSGGGAPTSGSQNYGGARVSNPIQGFPGSANVNNVAPYPSGGGGGASGPGGNAAGGSAMSSSITGTSTSYAGGGGGGNQAGYYGGSGSTSGGGGGAGNGTTDSTTGGTATPNTGSGGGGGGFGANTQFGTGGGGGAGVIILRYPTSYTASSTLAYTNAVVPGSTDKFITITGTGTGTVTFT